MHQAATILGVIVAVLCTIALAAIIIGRYCMDEDDFRP